MESGSKGKKSDRDDKGLCSSFTMAFLFKLRLHKPFGYILSIFSLYFISLFSSLKPFLTKVKVLFVKVELLLIFSIFQYISWFLPQPERDENLLWSKCSEYTRSGHLMLPPNDCVKKAFTFQAKKSIWFQLILNSDFLDKKLLHLSLLCN